MDSIPEKRTSAHSRPTDRFKSITVTSDLLKIDNRQADRLPNPQRINIDWLEVLVGRPISATLGSIQTQKIYGDENHAYNPRWAFYSQCGLPMESASWAYVYEGKNVLDRINEFLGQHFNKNDLMICFEAPEYLVKYFIAQEISYIDFTIHPVRFLPDYMFGVRTNVRHWRDKLAAAAIPDQNIRDFARISAARTMRIYRKNVPPQGSALFLGQIEIDSSLIHHDKMANIDDVELALLSLSAKYPKIYYKVHPHLKDHKPVKAIVEKISNCEWIDVNIYDAFACGAFDMIATLSSGGAIEARYFGCNSHWFLNRTDYSSSAVQDSNRRYYAIYQSALEESFWDYVFDDTRSIESFRPHWPVASLGGFKFTLNQKWGR